MAALVYSTELGRICPQCQKAVGQCICKKGKDKTAKMGSAAINLSKMEDGIVRIGRESKGRGGKGVTLIAGLNLEENALKDLAKKLKQKCGTGGTVKAGIVEIQGDHREKLAEELKKMGYKVKLAGG